MKERAKVFVKNISTHNLLRLIMLSVMIILHNVSYGQQSDKPIVWPEGKKVASNTAYFTFVAVDKEGKPIEVPEIEPENEDERALYDGALRRRQLRLILTGRMKPSEANELRSIFELED